jgi:hypothetical protein
MAAFMTLRKAHKGIESYFDMWNYFFCVRLQQDSDVKAVVLDSVDLYVRSGPRVDP